MTTAGMSFSAALGDCENGNEAEIRVNSATRIVITTTTGYHRACLIDDCLLSTEASPGNPSNPSLPPPASDFCTPSYAPIAVVATHSAWWQLRLVRYLLQDGEVAWVPGLRDDIELAAELAQHGVMDVLEVGEAQLLLRQDGRDQAIVLE